MRNRASSVDHRKAQEKGHALYHRPPARLAPSTQSVPPIVPPPAPATSSPPESHPAFLGIPVKYIALVTLAVQNAALSIIMHYSRVVTSPKQAYSAATAVLMNELTKGLISFAIALARIEDPAVDKLARGHGQLKTQPTPRKFSIQQLTRRAQLVIREVLSADCWKLSIPAILYVIQNNLQFVAAANLDVVVFQVSYQMKILTTAACSVIMLGKRLTSGKWLSLFLLALGVAVVQLQTATPNKPTQYGIKGEAENPSQHTMHHLKGITAVILACFTSGLAGVYFEMVLKGSKADLWIRNVQLSLFSLIPALAPILFGPVPVWKMFDGFGFWAWSTVITQVAGGLITALVIKFSDNIIKGFATSISIVLSFLASVILFNFRITPAFVIGALTVMAATWMYNQPQQKPENDIYARSGRSSFPGSPLYPSSPILGQIPDKRRTSLAESSPKTVTISPRAVAAALGLSSSSDDLTTHRSDASQSWNYNSALAAHSIHSNVSSRAPSPPLPREPDAQEQIGVNPMPLK